MSLVGKLTVPKTLAGRALGRKTMQDDDDVDLNPPVQPGQHIITESGDPVVTEGGDPTITE